MPTARNAAAIAQIDGTIFVVGGYTASFRFHANNEAYDLASNTWTMKAPMPTARDLSGTNGAVVAGKMYVIGGNNGYATTANEAYDPKTDTWTTRSPMPTPRANLAVVALDGLIYAIGGTNTSGSVRYQTVEVYNPATDKWTIAPPMPTARDLLAAAVINGIIYVAGGFRITAGSLNTFEAFDPKSRTWTTKAPLPTPRRLHAVGVINGSLIVVGGTNNLTLVSTVDVYDPVTNAWASLASSFPGARNQPAVVAANNVLFAIGGGLDLEGNKSVTNNEEFIPPQCWAR
ncbi:MAG TPA: kelch repeat-containing protein [Candidatus Binatia bacterium]|nr:kelch repeat-containing protein [Candidatus Binatia bacterium]